MKLLIANARADGWTGFIRHRRVLEYTDAHGREITARQVQEHVDGRRVLFAVHGYRSENEKAKDAYDRWQGKLSGCGYDVMIGFRWPGGWARAAFALTQRRTDEAGKHMATAIAQTQYADHVTVMAHSLGADVTLHGWQAVRAFSPQFYAAWKRTVFVAPAIPWDMELPPHSTVCFSPNDGALKWYERRHAWTRKAMGLRGPKPGLIARREQFDGDHSDYFDDARFLEVLA